MVNKIDREEFRFIEVAFILKTNLRHVSTIDIDGKDSLKHLQDIIESTKPMIKTLCLVLDEVERTYRNATNIMSNSKRILEYHFIWARMILEFYYFYHDTREESLKIANKMLSLEGYEYIKEAVQEGIKLIDNYYDSEWKETIPDTPKTKKPQFEVAQEKDPQQLVSAPCPDLIQIMQNINAGKIHYSGIDWRQQINAMLRLGQLMPAKFPYVIWLWGLLGVIDDPTTRMDILGEMQNAAPKCFNNRDELNSFLEDSHCIYYLCSSIREYNLNGMHEDAHSWDDERKSLNDLANILSDKVVDPKLMVAITEEMYRASLGDRKQHMLTHLLRANRNIGHISMDNVVDFAKNLYITEGYRQLILEGKENSYDIPTLAKFNWKIRNACFDVYIDLRKVQIKEEIEQDNTIVDGPDDIECLQKLLEQEQAVVDREKGLEQFQGSPAYNAMWYRGRPVILDTINVFIQYLKKRIEKAKKVAAEDEVLAAISSNSAVVKMAAIVKQAMAGNVEKNQSNITASAKEQIDKRPAVFISYSWDDKAHEDWVLKLATDLRSNNGIDVILDKWEMRLGKLLPHFMAHAVTDSNRVICVMTPNYKKKTENLEGGVGVEYSIITAEIQKNIKTEKFIPLFRRGEDVPAFLAGRDYIDMRDDKKYEEAIEELVRDILDKPKYKKPKLGPIPQLN